MTYSSSKKLTLSKNNVSKEDLKRNLNELISCFKGKFEEARNLRLFVLSLAYRNEKNGNKNLMFYEHEIIDNNKNAKDFFRKLTEEEKEIIENKAYLWSVESHNFHDNLIQVEIYDNSNDKGKKSINALIKYYEETLIPEYEKQIRILIPLKEKLMGYWGEEVVNKISQTIEEKNNPQI